MRFPDFSRFFELCHGTKAYSWQIDLAERVYRDRRWPPALDLPTASGKTAAIDIALFVLARSAHEGCPGDFPRRIFLVVDRRVLVDQAWSRGEHLLRRIAEDGALSPVREALASIGPDAPASVRLRGACPTDRRWATAADQVLLIAATVDQVGSRLLLRGYGVSPSIRPVEAGLVGQDALILLDEAHLAGPFLDTLRRMDELDPVRGLPVRRQVVQLGATLASVGEDRFHLPEELLRPEPPSAPEDAVLHRRLFAQKRLRWTEESPEELLRMLDEHPSVLVVANTVATARQLHHKLTGASWRRRQGNTAPERALFLVTGRMRPVDRQRITDEIDARLAERAPTLVVATQCIEAGVNWDFDALITECASWDALVQRLGRLNRTGREGDFPAHVISAQRSFQFPKYVEGAPTGKLCPVYLEHERITAEWLAELGELEAPPGALPSAPEGATRPPGRAPLLAPEYLDLWAQNRADGPGYDVGAFLHGPTEDSQVQVIWRDIQLEADQEVIAPLLKALPPSSLEAAPVPIPEFRRWAEGRDVIALLGEPELRRADDIAPGMTVVVPLAYGGIAEHATFDPASRHQRVEDVAAEALRDHRGLDYELHEAPPLDDESPVEEQVKAWLGASPERSHLKTWDWVDAGRRWLFVSRLPLDGEEDDGSSFRRRAVSLERHLNGVEQRTKDTARRLGLREDLSSDLALAARLHDLGKLDDRFQRLCGRTPGEEALGKSGLSWWARRRRAALGDYPRGERHEALSVELMHRHGLHRKAHDPELVEHLVASHHGWARPFTRVAQGQATIRDTIFGLDASGSVTHEEAERAPARFDRVQRRYGWLGLAWMEAILRLADHRQSDAEERGEVGAPGGSALVARPPIAEVVCNASVVHEVPLSTLSGLVAGDYLASLGVLRALDIGEMRATLQWRGTTPVVRSDCSDLDTLIDVFEEVRASFRGTWPGELNRLDDDTRAELVSGATEPFRSLVVALICEVGRSEMDFVSGGRGGFVSNFNWATTTADSKFQRNALQKTLAGPRELVTARTFRWSALAAQGARRPAVASADGRAEPWIEWLSLLGVSGLLCVPESRRNGTLAARSTAMRGQRASEKVLRWPLWRSPLPWGAVRAAFASSPRALPDALWCEAERRPFGAGTNIVYGFGPGQPVVRTTPMLRRRAASSTLAGLTGGANP